MKTWRLGTLVAEAVRNLAASWPRTVVTAFAVAGLVGALAWSELSTTSSILGFHRGFIAAGGNVVVASHEQGLPASRCAALAARPDVMAAGALNPVGTAETNLAPGTLFQTAEFTPGIMAVWNPPDQMETALADGIVVGSAVATELGLTDGMNLGYGNPPAPVVVVDTEDRNPQTARWIMIAIAPQGSAGQCWVELQPGAASTGQALMEHVFADAGPELAVRPLIRLDQFARDPQSELTDRPQVGAWIPAGATLTLLIWLGLWFRRSDLSLYRILGTTRIGLWHQTQTETILVLLIAGAIGYLWAVTSYGAITGIDPTTDQYLIAVRTTQRTRLRCVMSRRTKTKSLFPDSSRADHEGSITAGTSTPQFTSSDRKPVKLTEVVHPDGRISQYPPSEVWDDWVEWDGKEWPKREARRYTLVPTVCFNCESACGLLAYVDKDTYEIRKFEGNPVHPGSRGRNWLLFGAFSFTAGASCATP